MNIIVKFLLLMFLYAPASVYAQPSAPRPTATQTKPEKMPTWVEASIQTFLLGTGILLIRSAPTSDIRVTEILVGGLLIGYSGRRLFDIAINPVVSEKPGVAVTFRKKVN